jgi:outer membrane biosynthesis protein TonB
MNAVTPQQEQPLRAQIDDAHQQVGGLEHDLHAIDSELQNLSTERERYELLAQACGSLEKLGALGSAELFWGEDIDGTRTADHLHRIRQRVDGFLGRLAEATDRRQALVERIAQGREVVAILEDDLQELRDQEEERQHEWVVEREIGELPARATIMPWTRGGEDDRRFRKSLGSSLAAVVLLGLLLPFVDLPIPERAEIIEVPEHLVRLIRQERRPVPPQQPIVEEAKPEEPEPLPEPEPEPEPLLAEQPPPEQAAPPPEQAPAPQPEPPRERAQASGILAFRESFSTLAENRPSTRLGSDARISTSGDAAIGRPERAMVTSQAPGSSGGINLSSLSRDVGGGGEGGGPQIAGVQTTRVASAIGPGGGGDRPLAGQGGAAGRTDEEIQIVFDRYKASLYRLYNRELRNDPTLRGQMVLRLTIQPDGTVSMCELQSSDMNAPNLVQQVLERVRTFDFGAKDVAPITISYPIDFLPAA